MEEHRYYVVSPGGEGAFGYDSAEAARAVACDYGPGAHIVDTAAMPYHPMVHRVDDGGEPVYLEYGAWDTRVGADRNLIEAIKKGYAPIVQAFLAKGANVNATDGDGGTAAAGERRGRRRPRCGRHDGARAGQTAERAGACRNLAGGRSRRVDAVPGGLAHEALQGYRLQVRRALGLLRASGLGHHQGLFITSKGSSMDSV
jgi:hypothetical protein